ncbi:MAG: hypothetical protein ABFS28_08700 [Bacteroidota bacterium]
MQFKQLEIKPEGTWLKRTLNSSQLRKSLIAIALGAVIGFVLFYLTEGRQMESMPGKDILKSILIGGFFGFFYTNSPCARGRC